jgi:hypothetical protein
MIGRTGFMTHAESVKSIRLFAKEARNSMMLVPL